MHYYPTVGLIHLRDHFGYVNHVFQTQWYISIMCYTIPLINFTMCSKHNGTFQSCVTPFLQYVGDQNFYLLRMARSVIGIITSEQTSC